MKHSRNRNVSFLLRTYVQQIQELYDFEKQFAALVSQLSAGSLTDELEQILREHVRRSEEHAVRLEQIMKRLAVQARETHFRDTSRLLTNLRRLIKESTHRQDPRHEAAILMALHKVEAFEIACYGVTHNYARLLSFHDDLLPLERTYNEEKAMEARVEGRMRQLKNVSRRLEYEMAV